MRIPNILYMYEKEKNKDERYDRHDRYENIRNALINYDNEAITLDVLTLIAEEEGECPIGMRSEDEKCYGNNYSDGVARCRKCWESYVTSDNMKNIDDYFNDALLKILDIEACDKCSMVEECANRKVTICEEMKSYVKSNSLKIIKQDIKLK